MQIRSAEEDIHLFHRIRFHEDKQAIEFAESTIITFQVTFLCYFEEWIASALHNRMCGRHCQSSQLMTHFIPYFNFISFSKHLC